MLALVADLPAGGLQWQAGAEMASLGGIAAHILLVEGYAIYAVGRETFPGWTGQNGQGMDAPIAERALRNQIVDTDRRAKDVLCDVDEQRLLARHEGNGRTVFDVFVEEMDHAAMHYGHMQLARQLYEQHHPQFESEYRHWR